MQDVWKRSNNRTGYLVGSSFRSFCTSATKDKGVKELLDALGKYGLSPAAAKRRLEGMESSDHKPVEPTEASEFLGLVFKVVNDKYVGHLSFVRVLSGKLTPNHNIIDLNNGKSVRVGQLLLVQGSNLKDIFDHPKFTPDSRPGTFGNGTAKDKIDFILLSPELFARVTNGGIERRGVWGGAKGTLFPHFPEITREIEAASDHAAISADLDL